MIPLLWVALLAPPDTLLVEVRLAGVGAVVVEATLDADSTLRLPTRDLAALFGVPLTTAPMLTLAELGRLYPTLAVIWAPRELRVLVDDPYAVLGATQRRRAQTERRAVGGPGAYVTTSGPWLAFSADDNARHVVELGYSYKGLLAFGARRSSVSGTTWSVGVAPSPILFASITGAHVGAQQPIELTSASARLALGRTWLSASWSPARWHADALATVGPISVFASSQETFVVTIKGPGADLQVGRRAGVSAFHISVGSFRSSPFVFPTTY